MKTTFQIHVCLFKVETTNEQIDYDLLEEEEVAGCRDEYTTEESAREAFAKVKKVAVAADEADAKAMDENSRRQIHTNTFQLGIIRKALAALPVEALTAAEHVERQLLVDMAAEAIDSTPEILHGWTL